MNINRQKLKKMLCNSKKCIIFTVYCSWYGSGSYKVRKSRLRPTLYSAYLELVLIRIILFGMIINKENWGIMLNAPSC